MAGEENKNKKSLIFLYWLYIETILFQTYLAKYDILLILTSLFLKQLLEILKRHVGLTVHFS